MSVIIPTSLPTDATLAVKDGGSDGFRVWLESKTKGRWSFTKGEWIPPKDMHKESTAAYVDTFRGARNIHSVICKACGVDKKTLPLTGDLA